MSSSSQPIEKPTDIQMEMILLAKEHNFHFGHILEIILVEAATKGIISILDKGLSNETVWSSLSETLLKKALVNRNFDTFMYLISKLKDLDAFKGVSLDCICWCVEKCESEMLSVCLENYDFKLSVDRRFDEEFNTDTKSIFMRAYNAKICPSEYKRLVQTPFFRYDGGSKTNGMARTVRGSASQKDLPHKKVLNKTEQKGCIRVIFKKYGFFDVEDGIQLVDQAYDGNLLAALPTLTDLPVAVLDACLLYLQLSPFDYLNRLEEGHPQTARVFKIINGDFVRLRRLTLEDILAGREH